VDVVAQGVTLVEGVTEDEVLAEGVEGVVEGGGDNKPWELCHSTEALTTERCAKKTLGYLWMSARWMRSALTPHTKVYLLGSPLKHFETDFLQQYFTGFWSQEVGLDTKEQWHLII
jgi:hypothetical protein